MLTAAVAGLLWANIAPGVYHDAFSTHIEIGIGQLRVAEELHGWINEGLMTFFFFAVGLEIKRELAVGELQDARSAALPAIAALGGMLVPAAIFFTVNLAAPSGDAAGWAIPVATDIAFTLGVLSLLGDRVPVHLRLFILTLAIVDDVGGIVIIAVAFSEGLSIGYLAATGASLVGMAVMQRAGVRSIPLYLPVGIVAWYFAWHAGIEPTIAGVTIGLLTPAVPIGGRDVLSELEHRLHPINALVILPVFAIANTGIPVSLGVLGDAATNPVSLGVVAGLVMGKPIGIVMASRLAIRLGIGRLHPSVPSTLLIPAATLAGIGFTVALFISELSFEPGGGVLDLAKIGVLAGSLVAAIAGSVAYLVVHRRIGATDPADMVVR